MGKLSDDIETFDRALNAALSLARESEIPVAAAVGTLMMKAFSVMVDAYGIEMGGDDQAEG